MKRLPLFCFLLLLCSCSRSPQPFVFFKPDEQRFELIDRHGTALVAYQHATYPAPAGESPLYARSGFLHPIRSPKGQVLTHIQPADHYHHYGIWNPWTQVSYDGRIVDFWNLAKGQGTVRFAGLDESHSLPDSAGFTVRHEHVVFEDDGSETVALLETQALTLRPGRSGEQYLLDLEINYQCATEEPFTLTEYRYGGLGWRGPLEWNAQNSSVLTSEGLDRTQADGSIARWVIGQGEVDGYGAGIAFLSHPDNYNHPEPLRVWPPESHHGQLFLNVSPSKNTSWTLQPGQTYTQRYRLIVFSGKLGAQAAELEWQDFAKL